MKNKLIMAILFLPTLVFAQKKELSERQQKKAERKEKINQLIKQEEEGALIFNKQSIFGIKLNTDGYGIFYERGKYKTLNTTNIWWVELGEHKHPKETKFAKGDPTWGFVIGNPYVYAKINNFYNLKIGFGQQKLIGGKGNKNGVATSLNYGAGIAAAVLKPYYLDVIDQTGQTVQIKYADSDTLFLNQNRIVGASGFTKGFGEVKFVPGVHARVALRFDYGRYNETASAIEVGVNAEFYSKKVEHMAIIDNRQFLFNAYIAIIFGRRK